MSSQPVFHNNNVNRGNVDEENDKIRDNDDDNCNIIDNDYGFAADMVFRWDVITVSISSHDHNHDNNVFTVG